MGVRAWSVVALAAVLATAGCTGGQSRTARPDGLRTDPDGQGLVANYLGGACDGPARLDVRETRTRIDADVVVGPSDLPEGSACVAIGIPRTVATRLARPVGTRTIWSDGREQVPFDGSRLLVPQGASEPREGGGRAGDDQPVDVTDAWGMQYTDPGPAVFGSTCSPALGSLSITVGQASRDDPTRATTKAGTARIGTAEATLYRSSVGYPPGTHLTYVWSTARGVVELSADIRCGHYRSLTPDELLRVARSLRPA